MPAALAGVVLRGAIAPAAAAEYPWLRAGDRGRFACVPLAPIGPEVAPPDGWQQPGFDDSTWRAPDGGAAICDALRMRRRFDVGPELARLAALTLEVKYQDGFVAWINGVEVARRRLVDGQSWAAEPHGADPERFYLPATPGL